MSLQRAKTHIEIHENRTDGLPKEAPLQKQRRTKVDLQRHNFKRLERKPEETQSKVQ